MDVCPSVLHFGEQPLTVHYLSGDGSRWHVPDFLVETADLLELIEIKFARDVTHDVLDRTELLVERLKPFGIGYRLLTEAHIRSGLILENADRVLRRGRERAPALWALNVHHALAKHGSSTLGHFGWGRSGHAQAGWIARQILEGKVCVDFRFLLDSSAIVSNPSPHLQKENHPWLLAASR
jgi:hypothetical protein